MQVHETSLEGRTLEQLLRIADILLKKGELLPVDLTARLLGYGVDVDAMERKASFSFV